MRLGIDIGTHTARAAYLDEQGRPQLVRLPDGSDSLPAMARQTMHGLEVGAEAARALAGNAETTLCGCTRLMGRASSLPPHLLERLPYPVRGVGGETVCNLLYQEVRAGEVYGLLIQKLVEAAARPVDEIVLTVPASAEDRFRVQARAAAEAHGLRVRRLLNQPAAALMAAALMPSAQHVAVVNCGGGTTEVTLARREQTNGTVPQSHILATAGDSLLGGDDFAWAVAERLNERFIQVAGVDVFAVGAPLLSKGGLAALGLKAAGEEALQTLCLAPETPLTLDHGGGFGRDLATVVRRSDVAAWLAPLMARLTALCERALAGSKLTAKKIDAVVMVGEWAHLPVILETVAEAFHRPVATLHTQNAALLPVYGAALATAADAPTVWDVTPYPLGINCYYGDTELFSPIIAANTPIPTPVVDASGAYTEQYQTRHPNQTEVKLDILQYRGLNDPNPTGSTPVQSQMCEVLGTWSFEGLQPKKNQHAAFTVTFAIDADGILHLQAKEKGHNHHLDAHVTRGIG
jgi:molecular chaperone DnaK